MVTSIKKFVFVCLLVLTSVVVGAEKDPAPESDAESADTFPRLSVIDAQRDKLSRSLVSVADSIDRFLGSTRYDEENNKTEIRLRSISSIDYRQQAGHKLDTVFNLDLPATNKRFRLVIKTEQAGEDDESLPGFVDEFADSQTPDVADQETIDEEEPEGVSAAIQLVLNSGDKWDVRATTGLLFALPSIDPIAEFRVRRNIPVGKWNTRITNHLYWLASRDLTNDSRIEFERSLSSKNFLRMTSYAVWEQYYPGWRTGEDISIVHTVDAKKAFIWSTGITDINRLNQRDHYYYVGGRFRHMFHRDWVFYQFHLFSNYLASENFISRPGASFSLEFIFGR